VKTPHRSVTTLQIYPGFNEALLHTFKLKVNVMANQLKLCCVVLDELAIKENVSYNLSLNNLQVVVFMLKYLGENAGAMQFHIAF